jgi:hypothetical protein
MELKENNYYSNEADVSYMSVSQYHNFVGTPAYRGCYAKAKAILQGNFEKTTSMAMLIGSYVDAYFEGTLEHFKQLHPEILTQKKELRAEFKLAERLIGVAESDVYFTKFIYDSKKQEILTGEIGGVKWKGKLDYLFPDVCIVDLKCIKSIKDRVWADGYGKVNYIDAGGYIDQATIYQELVRQKYGKKLPFYHAVISKESPIDHEIIEIPQPEMDIALEMILQQLPDVIAAKESDLEPHRCGVCDYCVSTKKLSEPKSYYDL